MSTAARHLKQLEALRFVFGAEAAASKAVLLDTLARAQLSRSRDVLRLHETLCFMQAYPDNSATLERVERLLTALDRRRDLRTHRHDLADTGIRGTDTFYSFFHPTAQWLVRRCPAQLSIDWPEFENKDQLVTLLPTLLPYAESMALDALDLPLRQWLKRLKGADETDAAFIVRRFAAARADAFIVEKLYDGIGIPMRLAGSGAAPSRTMAKIDGSPVAYQPAPLSRERPDLAREIRRRPRRVRLLSPTEGRRYVDAAVAAMVTRGRDLDAFAYGDPHDVRLVEFDGGLQFACIGQIAERRLMLETVYGFLMIKNGVPIGYGLMSALFNSCEIAFNIFETFRGAEAALMLARSLAAAHHLFGADAFSVDPYQLGHGNSEGLKSGAWWFYYKLGFRTEDAALRKLVDKELHAIKRDARHRSSIATLQALSSEPMYFYLRDRRDDLVSILDLGAIGLRVSIALAERAGADREHAVRSFADEAAQLLGVRGKERWPIGERRAWERWGPLITRLPGVSHWSAARKRELATVVRAKGGRRESDYTARFDRHQPLRQAIVKLARDAEALY